MSFRMWSTQPKHVKENKLLKYNFYKSITLDSVTSHFILIQLVSSTVNATVPYASWHKAVCIFFHQHLVELTGTCMFLYWTIQSHSTELHVCFIWAVCQARSAALRPWVHIAARKPLHLSHSFSQTYILLVSQVSSPVIFNIYFTTTVIFTYLS